MSARLGALGACMIGFIAIPSKVRDGCAPHVLYYVSTIRVVKYVLAVAQMVGMHGVIGKNTVKTIYLLLLLFLDKQFIDFLVK